MSLKLSKGFNRIWIVLSAFAALLMLARFAVTNESLEGLGVTILWNVVILWIVLKVASWIVGGFSKGQP